MRPFQKNIEGKVLEKDNKHLLPIGLVRINEEEILIAIPLVDEEGMFTQSDQDGLSLGEFNASYSKTGELWSLDSNQSDWSIPNPKGHYWYEKVYSAYQEGKKFFQENRYLQYPIKKENPNKSKTGLFITGEVPAVNSNWYSDLPINIRRELIDIETDFDKDQRVEIFDAEDNRFEFLGNVQAFHYIAPITAYFYYFYEPKTKRILVIAEYS